MSRKPDPFEISVVCYRQYKADVWVCDFRWRIPRPAHEWRKGLTPYLSRHKRERFITLDGRDQFMELMRRDLWRKHASEVEAINKVRGVGNAAVSE